MWRGSTCMYEHSSTRVRTLARHPAERALVHLAHFTTTRPLPVQLEIPQTQHVVYMQHMRTTRDPRALALLAAKPTEHACERAVGGRSLVDLEEHYYATPVLVERLTDTARTVAWPHGPQPQTLRECLNAVCVQRVAAAGEGHRTGRGASVARDAAVRAGEEVALGDVGACSRHGRLVMGRRCRSGGAGPGDYLWRRGKGQEPVGYVPTAYIYYGVVLKSLLLKRDVVGRLIQS
ncbi:hypothetical protein BZA05DRAFT_209986 [Tricharina praecox]|uniref:uncharacterized protein n=1 Tax=Tricharina praecox TaxID=43433 RepID=UPI00221EB02C|nr:uncharacterized protein BZA05DRAFT_209986 [Tricharina praecox]KAI5841712.1 hypothetical protein BZA05DRAFT_209986 [Tricharina praecox]